MAPNTTWHVASISSVSDFNFYYGYKLRKHPFTSTCFSMHFNIADIMFHASHLLSHQTTQLFKSPNINIKSLCIFRDKHCGCETIQILPFPLFSMNPFLDYTLYYSRKKWVILGARKMSPIAPQRRYRKKKDNRNDNRRSLIMD